MSIQIVHLIKTMFIHGHISMYYYYMHITHYHHDPSILLKCKGKMFKPGKMFIS